MYSQVKGTPRVAPAVSSAVPQLAASVRQGPPPRDAELTGRLLARDEDTFREVVVVQETWIAVLGGLAGFQGRSSLRDGLNWYYAERGDRADRQDRTADVTPEPVP